MRKIRTAGGIILAKSSLSEFAYGSGDNINSVLSGFTRNPYNTAFATGGSSGGTAAALAVSFGVVNIGSDAGNWVRSLKIHGLKGDRLGVLRQVFETSRTDPTICSITLFRTSGDAGADHHLGSAAHAGAFRPAWSLQRQVTPQRAYHPEQYRNSGVCQSLLNASETIVAAFPPSMNFLRQ